MNSDIRPRAKNNRLEADFVAGIDLDASKGSMKLEQDLQKQDTRDKFW